MESVRLAPLVVIEAKPTHGMREEFEERRRMGFGSFIDSTVLRNSEQLRLPDVLRRVNGISLVQRRNTAYAVSIRRPGCYVQVILDGNVSRVLNLLDFDIAALEAVEVYRSAAETPSDFNSSGAACGTIVLWSRLGR
jgi:hypothetical protein